MTLIDRIEALFHDQGSRAYEGARQESVSALAHALQCAQLAEQARAEPSLIAAALLHDIGHFLVRTTPADDHRDDTHEVRALPFLYTGFGAAVTEPVRLHVQAKRYLVATDPTYFATLSPASVHSLALQGGPMSLQQQHQFQAQPFHAEAVALRRWDDA
ncbi:MAG: HD domain-containing protein, partial [Pseudomonadota bacterium]